MSIVVSKEIKIKVLPKQFFSASATEALKKKEAGEEVSVEEQADIDTQSDLVKDGFGVDRIDEEVNMSLKMEDFVFDLFQLLPEPSAPLRKAAHQKYIMGIAQQLSSTIDLPESMPTLSDEDLDKVKHFIDNDDAFLNLQVKFQYVKKKSEEPASMPLNPQVLGMSPGFINTLAVLFKQI